jgi:hypothetical protein
MVDGFFRACLVGARGCEKRDTLPYVFAVVFTLRFPIDAVTPWARSVVLGLLLATASVATAAPRHYKLSPKCSPGSSPYKSASEPRSASTSGRRA